MKQFSPHEKLKFGTKIKFRLHYSNETEFTGKVTFDPKEENRLWVEAFKRDKENINPVSFCIQKRNITGVL